MSERSLVADRESQVNQQTVVANDEVAEFLRSKLTSRELRTISDVSI